VYPKADSAMFARFRPFVQTYNHVLISNSGKTE